MSEIIEHKPTETELTAATALLHNTRSEEVQEIMGRMPSWIIRWGITAMFVVCILVITGSYFFKYPDIIPARVTISSANPPVKLIARNNLPIAKIFVGNDETVQSGQILCILSNTADYEQVGIVASWCKLIDTTIELRALAINKELPPFVGLGELQSAYISLFQAWQEYKFFLNHNSYGTKINHLSDQGNYQSLLSLELQKKDTRLKEQLNIQKNRFETDSALVANQVMSRIEYENAKKDLLNQQMNTESNYSTILQSKLQEKEIQKNISETSIELQVQENTLQQKIREAGKQLIGTFTQWEQNYIIRTPVQGKVTFFKFWKENQFVQAGEAVMVVTPEVQEYVARGEIAVSGAGKVKPGQKVLIKLMAYPYEEFGSLNGSLQSRSSLSLDSTFAVEIKLENRLRTNAGQTIPDQPQLEAIAEIMTENKSLLQRLFENLYGKRRR
ncbi:HlyD family secretion protein [Pedobacter panaciterrae]